MPTVDTVICRQPSPPSRLSAIRSTAGSTASKLCIGSPMPMNTTVRRRRLWAVASRRNATNWAMISPAVRLRSKPALPVAQKSQPIAHPAWEDRQPAARAGSWSGIRTASTVRPSVRPSSSLMVPSAASWRRMRVAGLGRASTRVRSAAGGRNAAFSALVPAA